jgi:hypothetical protein
MIGNVGTCNLLLDQEAAQFPHPVCSLQRPLVLTAFQISTDCRNRYSSRLAESHLTQVSESSFMLEKPVVSDFSVTSSFVDIYE